MAGVTSTECRCRALSSFVSSCLRLSTGGSEGPCLVTTRAPCFGSVGWNFKKEAQAMASCAMPERQIE